MSLAIGNTASRLPDIDKRRFLWLLPMAILVSITTTTSGCASVLQVQDPREILKEVITKKVINFNGNIEKISRYIEIEWPDEISGNYVIVHPKLWLITSKKLEITPEWVLVEQDIIIDGDAFFVAIAAKQYWWIKIGDTLRAREEKWIIYVEKKQVEKENPESIAQNEKYSE